MLLIAMTVGCADSPCADVDGSKLYVFPPTQEQRSVPSNARVFETIQDALDHAEPGTAVCVAEGHYRESPTVYTPDVMLYGAGPERTEIIPETLQIRAPGTTVLSVGAAGVHVRGFSLRHGATGIYVEPGTSALVEDVALEDNGVGLLAPEPSGLGLVGLDVARNTSIGLLVTANHDFPTVTVHGGRFVGNGTLGESEVGGIYSDTALELRGVTLRDNVGELTADVFTQRGLTLTDVVLERAARLGGAPRISSQDGLVARDLSVHTYGSVGLDIGCREGGVEIDNLALSDAGGGATGLVLEDCVGRIAHATLVDTTQTARPALSGTGTLEIVNTAFVGFGAPDLDGSLQTAAVFTGTASDAALMRPLPVDPDLRPQSDSPLIDAGVMVGVGSDLDGRPRPSGDAPDIGAYELY
ncbi:MAG TPA: choice-of-anchor Q domain-containing protein [Myxococcota bacterium]|nr:choice-of-anchor Q domain-containing protein [Myxococcota bacterium]